MQARFNAELRSGLLFLGGLSALGWSLILWSVANMSSPLVSLMMPMDANWGLSEMMAVWLMWAVMMGAMMLPSAIPLLMVHRRVATKKDTGSTNTHHYFLVGYIVTWTLFSAAATATQWGFQRADILSHMLMLQDRSVAGFILIAVGVFQFSSIKSVCLKSCRAPIGFLLTNWQPGRSGAFHMGL